MNKGSFVVLEPEAVWLAREMRRRERQKRKDAFAAFIFCLAMSSSLVAVNILEAVL